MGGKRNIQRYKSLFYPACCLIFIWVLAGCQYDYYPKVSIENNKGEEGKKFLDSARDFAAKGDFTSAFKDNTKAYELFPPEFKQAAIFQKALLHAHPDNIDRNYEKAVVCFELVDKNPNDWIFAYNSALIFSSLKESCYLAQKVSSNKKDIQKSKSIIKKSKNIIKKRQNKIQSLLEEQVKLKKYISKLRQQIDQLKEVDLSSKSEN